ncbi:MAG: sigma-70 family RNA polymerase sigma factor [Planctomycetota bacterium]|nr:MAG: sigma-70 family RNA polymerase sigma factor [Planctomycetota bacterium]
MRMHDKNSRTIRKRCMPRTDELKVIARAKRGNADAFRELVDAYKDRLFAFIWRMVRNHHEAEDVCQIAFVKAYESLHNYSENYAFSTWLFTIAYRVCLNRLRKKRALSGETDFSRVDGPAESDAAVTVANSEEAQVLRKRIWDAVDQLTPPQRTAVLLFYREGKSCQEIGVVLGIPAVTVKSHLHRARAKLKTLLGEQQAQDWLAVRDLRDSRLA